ncbi:MAG: YHYH protein [Deinococcales bacterium]|nr:YHYH protein [Chitinophagaceae bacterium]
MKPKHVFSVFFLCFLMLFNQKTTAHPGGHYHDADVINSWHLKNGEIISGNFSMGKNDFILLEQKEGVMVKVLLSELSEQDQLLALVKINKYEKLNNEFISTINAVPQTNKVWNYFYVLLSLVFGFAALFLFSKMISILNKSSFRINKSFAVPACFALMIVSTYACKKSTENVVTATTTTTTTTSTVIPKTTTGFIDSAIAPYKPSVGTNWDATYFYISSNGLPSHNKMVGITNWQQQVPIPQFYTGANSWSIPLQPVYAAAALSTKTNFMKGAVAIAANGIPIFNALNNRGEDSYLIGELDNWGGHCGKADDYHYHAAPLHLSTTSGLMPIAFALDGFAIYGAKEPDGMAMQALDTCHGHIYNNGVYHYHGTTNYPYVIGAMKGKVTTDPSTPAPENQILPQAFASPLRPALTPLNGAAITAYTSTGTNAYKLTYTIGTGTAFINYSWDATNKYTFVFKGVNGTTTTSIYQR